MSKWSQRKAAIAAESDYDHLLTIPMIELQDCHLDAVIQRIAAEFRATNAKRIYVADPYLNETDVELIRKMFDGVVGREIIIITRFSNIPSESSDKCSTCSPDQDTSEEGPQHLTQKQRRTAVANVVKSTVDDLTKKGIFKELKVLVVNFKFHDRFIFCSDEGSKGLLLWCGTSLNHFMSQYGGIIRISNHSFKRQVIKFIDLAEKDNRDLDCFIAEISSVE